MSLDLVLRAPRAIIDGRETSVSVGVAEGRIAVIDRLDADLSATETFDLGDDEVLLPGLVDSHVHINEPGRTEWEGFASATRAGAAGGVTTIIDMPLNSIPPTCTVAALEEKKAVAEDQVMVDVGFWGGAIPGNVADLAPLHDAGVFGFKCFLLHSGVDEFPPLGPEELEEAMRETRRIDALMIVHAEDSSAIDCSPTAEGSTYERFLHSRPRGAENLAVAQVIELSRLTGGRAHILHLSSSDALPMIRSARADGVRLTVETCPHYLTFTAEEIADGSTQFKCCPPIREAGNREKLWQGLREGCIDIIVSDHSPCTADLKRFDTGDFGQAWGGIAGVQFGLSAVWTGARQRGFTLVDVVRWMAEGPARQAGLATKGRIRAGAAADFAVFAPDEARVVTTDGLYFKNKVSAYVDRSFTGVVRRTWLAGIPIDLDGPPRGRLLRRGQA